MILLTVTAMIILYCLQQLLISHTHITMIELIFLIINILSSLLLVVVAANKVNLSRSFSKSSAIKDEDAFYNSLERKFYRISNLSLTVLMVAFMSFITGFILIRNDNPKIIFTSFVIGIITLLFLISDSKITSIVLPNYKQPTTNTKTPIMDTLNMYDDGQKYLLLNSLYKLYFLIISLLVLLIFVLMYYSVFTGINQTVGIIGVGLILLISLICMLNSLKSPKVNEK